MKKDIRLTTKINTLNDYADILKNHMLKIETIYNLNIHDKELSDEFTTRAMSVMSERLEESGEYFQTHLENLVGLIEEVAEENRIEKE